MNFSTTKAADRVIENAMKTEYPFLLDIPAKDYHADSASGRYLSSHNLAQFRACPHTYHLLMTGKMRRPETPALALGRAIHCFTLEGFDAWNREFTVTDGPINKTTGQPYGRTSQKFIDFMASQSKSVVSCREFEAIEKMAENVWTHPEAKKLLESGIAEGTIRNEDYCGIAAQARTDWFAPDYGIVDLKTTSDGLEWFETTAHKYGYAYQMAFYRRLLELASGVKYPVYIIAVEKAEPYRAAVFRYAEDVLDQAESENESAIRELLDCRERDEWPTRFQETRPLTRI